MLRRERLSSALKNQQYIPQLLDVFQKAEDIEDETALKSLYEIFKAIWMLNQGEIYEILFNQKYIFVSHMIKTNYEFLNLGRGGSDGIRSVSKNQSS